MIGFTSGEILISALCALAFGIVYSVIHQLALILSRVFKSLPDIIREIMQAEKLLPPPSVKERVKEEKEEGVFAFFSVIGFAIGFLLLSYYALDGQLRLYMLIISSASLYFANSTFFVFLRGLSTLLLDFFLFVLSTLLRLLIIPIKRLFKNRKANYFNKNA